MSKTKVSSLQLKTGDWFHSLLQVISDFSLVHLYCFVLFYMSLDVNQMDGNLKLEPKSSVVRISKHYANC